MSLSLQSPKDVHFVHEIVIEKDATSRQVSPATPRLTLISREVVARLLFHPRLLPEPPLNGESPPLVAFLYGRTGTSHLRNVVSK
jgi:hypothetical protein